MTRKKKRAPNTPHPTWYKFHYKQVLGLFLQAIAAAILAVGIYSIIWLAFRPVYYRDIAQSATGGEIVGVCILFMVASLLWSLGNIEIHEYLKRVK